MQAVEEQAGALGVELVGGVAAEVVGQDGLEGGAVIDGGAGDGLARGVVVVAEGLAAEVWALAAAAVVEEMAASESV